MELNGYVTELRHQLAVAAATGGDDARDLADRLTAPLDAAVRLVLLDALATAAGEITSELAPGSVEVRLRGREPEFVVTSGVTSDETSDGEGGWSRYTDSQARRHSTSQGDDDGTTARVTLRLPDHLKQRAEAAAAADGVSVNNWLVRAVAAALDTTSASAAPKRRGTDSGSSFTGWVR